jgi:hypothetical protein
MWMLFNTPYEHKRGWMIKFEVVLTIGGIVGFAFSIFIITQIFAIVGSAYASKMKYFQMMDQLDAYAQKKQIPLHVQERLKFCFQEKFRNDQFVNEKFSYIFSDSLRNEILVNLGQKFTKYFRLLDGVSASDLTQMLNKCRKEYFLPNDIVRKLLILNSHVVKREMR